MSSSETHQNQAPGEQYFPPPPPGPPPSQQQQQQDHQSHPPQTEQHFPPPPPGPPPPQQQQQSYPQFAPPPQQAELQSYQPQDAHQQDQHQQHQQHQQQDHQPTEQQHFPPPPPGPPPPQSYQPQQQQQQQQQQYQPPQDFSQQHGQQQQPYNPQAQVPQQQASSYSIPAYNPANPVFAPPPSNNLNDPPSPAGYQPQADGQQPYQQHQQQHAPPSPQHGSGDEQQGHHKSGWGERLSALGMKAAAPINSIAHKLGSQSFLPETLDKECEKAATILKAFCKKGVYADPAATSVPTSTDPNARESTDRVIDPTKEKPKNRVIVTIPPRIISKAVGLAIFTTLRAGFQISGATGSGILIARLPDGSWSPPSGIQLHSVGGGFQIGLDIYDCVCVINNREALAAFTNTRVSLGSDLAVVAGPYGAGAAVEFGTSLDAKTARDDGRPPSSQGQGQDQQSQQQQQQSLQPPEAADKKSHRRSLSASATKPVFSYVKSRGFYAGIRVDGTVVAERKDANAAFYGQTVSVDQILKGQVPSQGPPGMWPAGAQTLFSVLRGAEAGVLQASSHEQQQPPSSPGHHQQQAPQGYYPQQGQAQGRSAEQQSYPYVPPPPSYADSGPRPIDGDIKYA
ncbi:hypothetical protein THAR02_05060 [Trichoderma harzianum]|uniref:Ysc84 actin-binding domain-containing protein n=1 Tax=Trichoderma harzianum TaxID=5544 RepID=A0A0F9XE26_TRIHA|nr:hypothetical protein THAR02_05060 [Trichoderma harzianum]